MSLYKEKLENPPFGNTKTRNHTKWKRWAKNQRNRFIRRQKKDCKAYKFFKYWEF